MTPFRIQGTKDGEPVLTGTSRVTNNEYRTDGGSVRKIVVTLGPADVITLRPQGTQREVRMTVEDVYNLAVRASGLADLRSK